MVWHSWIEAYEIAPLTIGASHLPLHLEYIFVRDLISFEHFYVCGRVWAFNLNAAILAHKPVRAGVSAYNDRMLI
jgi:hypothetical protein